MVLRMRLDINGNMIGTAVIVNVTDLSDISDYEYHVVCEGRNELGIKPMDVRGSILNHNRRQSALALIARVIEDAMKKST